MAFSGTISETVFNTRRVIDNAMRRCKIPAPKITSEHLQIAQDQLYLILSTLANQGIQLWCIENILLPLYEGQGAVTLPLGTVEVLNINLRTMQSVTGTDTDTSTEHKVEFDSATAVATVGVFWSAASAPLQFERSDDGVTWTVIQTEVNPGAVADEVTWFDLDSVVDALFFRVIATSGTLDFDSIYLGGVNPSEIPIGRLNRDQWTNLPNKVFRSNQPTQFWFDRQIPRPILRLNPIPNAQAVQKLITLWRQRHIMDVGTLTQELDIPQRWYMAIVTELARQCGREIPEVDVKLLPDLDLQAGIALKAAQEEERDNSPSFIAPNISMYTR